MWVSDVIHIGKESNGLTKSEFLGLDEDSYVEYSDVDSGEKIYRINTKDFGVKTKRCLQFLNI